MRESRARKPPTCRRRHHEGPHHNCAYVDAVNRKIPAARKSANQRMADYIEEWGEVNADETKRMWSRFFLEEMQVECEVAGLRRAGPREAPIIEFEDRTL